VASRPQRRTRPIRVALRFADRAVRARIADACAAADIAVADPDVRTDDADIVVADRPVATAAPVIALASGQDRDLWHRAMWGGDLRAVVPADLDAAAFAAVVEVVAVGLVVLPHRDGVADDIIEDFADEDLANEDLAPDPIDGIGADERAIALTPREREVLTLLAEGASNKAIARALAVSVHTAKFHVASLTDKLGAHGRVEAIAIAIRAGLVMV
jgi:DNA-binding NarL/FixJ family response regulator